MEPMGTEQKTRAKRGVSRRDFFRLTGGTAGVAATAAVIGKGSRSKAFAAGLEEAASESRGNSIHSRPWWVTEVDEPTTEIDWDQVERYNEHLGTTFGPGMARYVGEERANEIRELGRERTIRGILENEPGYSLKDRAVAAGASPFARTRLSWVGSQTASAPEELGVPRWEGTPSENANLVRAAFRAYGAATVGFVELDENTRKLIYSVDSDGIPIEFEDVDEGYETEEKRVIPNKARWVIVYTIQMSEEMMRLAPTPVGNVSHSIGYGRAAFLQPMAQDFLRALGYQGLGEAKINALAPAPAFGVLAGLGELGRFNRLITPEYGPGVRVHKMITDLPLEPTKPIDAGIQEFCKTCKICAESCPSDSISMEDEPFWEVPGEWSSPGHKTWYEDAVSCYEYWQTGPSTGCGICFGVCPYLKKDETLVHGLVKATSATTGLFNGFFRNMDEAFGYGNRDPEAWWTIDMPEYGIDTQRTGNFQA